MLKWLFQFVPRIVLIALICGSPTAWAQQFDYVIRGIDDPLLSNVNRHVKAFQLAATPGQSRRRTEKAVADAESRVRAALRPYGYYHPDVAVESRILDDGSHTITLDIDPGPPVLVSSVNVAVEGDGAEFRPLREWRTAWPLPIGAVLDQTKWEDHKQQANEILNAQGYFQAEFTDQLIELDLVNRTANLVLTLDTGARSVMGTIVYEQDILKLSVLEGIPRFETGEHYSAFLMEKLRTDLWKTGYFTAVEVVERPRSDSSPPVVDLQISLEAETRNTYQGSVGFGTDTDIRLQARWSRHPVSTNGDRIDVALGWQQFNNEFLLRPIYRIPRRSRQRQFWVSEMLFKTEQQDFDFKLTPEDEDVIRLAEGRINDAMLRLGRLKVRNLKTSGDQAFETIFLQYLIEVNELDLLPGLMFTPIPQESDIGFDRRLRGTVETLSTGIEWDRPSVRGKGFDTVGRRDRAWLFGASESLGSEVSFLQAYLATHRNIVLGKRWKFLLRAEAGYTDARVDRFTVEVGGVQHTLEVTQLPNLYRFRAGGSKSVRGYGFEDLSTNNLGSNNIFTASAEIEMKFLENWSAAAFIDIGNAFNDWHDPELKKGVGVGIRWYSIAGPIRVDVARALDFEGKPWRLHFTIGTPLL